jgi:hypothetical protein
MICKHLTPSPWTRTKYAVPTAKHVMAVVESIANVSIVMCPRPNEGCRHARR